MSEPKIRDAVEADVDQIVDIQNALLATTTIEWRDEPYSVASRRDWLAERAIVAAVDSGNAGSVRFHERLGFVEVGRLRGIGFKHDRWLDVVLLQRDLR